MFLTLILTFMAFTNVLARDDGLVLTPPMGWISFTRFAVETDCKKYPDACINEQLYKEMADRLVSDGFKDVGYEYVNIDDSWSEMERDSNHKLVANKDRFPSGIKSLADYMHSKGLKLGIYGDVGPKTCGGYPGQNGVNGSNYYTIDANTFAEWEVDSFKFDGCNEDPKHFDKLYPEMDKALNETGRLMVYICEWPKDQWFTAKIWPKYKAVTETCHVFRNFRDVSDSWGRVLEILEFYGRYNEKFIEYNGPGHFFDPDMLVIGDFGLSYEQSRTQMALWAMWSSPLYMSNDLRHLRPEFKAILQNKAVLALNQDRNGVMAKLVFKTTKTEPSLTTHVTQVWVKQAEPQVNGQWSYAVLYIGLDTLGDKFFISHKVSDLIPKTANSTQYEVHDLFVDEGKEILGDLKSSDDLKLLVAIGGGCRLVKLVPKE